MFDVFKKDSDAESYKIKAISKVEATPQKLETPQTTNQSQQIVRPQFWGSSSAINDLDLLVSLQKMKTEEQELFEQKQRLLTTEQNFHNKLVKEIDKKKMVITNLKSEITDLLNKCKELDQALGRQVSKNSSL